MVTATLPSRETLMPPSRRATLCPPRTKALAREKLWPSANQGSWVLEKKIFRAKRLIELRSKNSWRDLNSWRDSLGSMFLIHQCQMPKPCPILNFLSGDLPSCQIQLLNTLNPGWVCKEQIWNNIYFASQDGQKSSQHAILQRKRVHERIHKNGDTKWCPACQIQRSSTRGSELCGV